MRKIPYLLASITATILLNMTIPGYVRAASSSVVIHEVQLQSDVNTSEEFIEISNTGLQPVDITGWRIAYITATGASVSVLATLKGQLAAGGFALYAKTNYLTQADGYFDKGLSEGGGHVQLLDASGQEKDRVGWGTAAHPEDQVAPVVVKGLTLSRVAGVDTDDNSHDFIAASPTPIGGDVEDINLVSICSALALSEILPNPAGSDAEGGEFIEVYNTSLDQEVLLSQCTLATDKAASLPFANDVLAAGGYAIVDLKDKLLNGSGTVKLLQGEDVLQTITYQEVDESSSWALIDGVWQHTLAPTPGLANILTSPAVARPAETTDSPLTECPAGKYRNPETGRCKASEESSEPVACKAGQERNPETNRCRAVTLVNAPLSCGVGQERNPETNRCRRIAQATETAKACPAGQERNPETNRCRKVPVAAVAKAGQDPPQASSGKHISLAVIAFAGVAAISYGLYEYRTDIRNKLAAFRAKISRAHVSQ